MADRDLTTTPEQRAELERLLSADRYATYRAAASEDCDPLDLYLFNMNAASALLGPLHILEVVMRNAMHARLAAYAGRDDWWATDVPLSPKHWVWIDEGIKKTERSHALQGKPKPTPGDQVADFDFRIWTVMLERGPRKDGTEYERVLWQPIIRLAFPHFRGQRDWLDKLANRARVLRNRVSHHEPIFTTDLERDYKGILALVGYISPEVRGWLAHRSRLGGLAGKCPPVGTPIQWF